MNFFQMAVDYIIAAVRFNPDGYRNEAGEQVKSCWKANKQGVIVVPKEKKVEWEARIEHLFGRVSYWLDTVPDNDEMLEIEELFFD